MEEVAFGALLVSGFLHASWNAIVKGALDPLVSIAYINIGMGVLAVGLFIISPFPARESWPFIGAAVIIHSVYNVALARAYDQGDYVQIYPIARGAAPLVVLVGSVIFLPHEIDTLLVIGVMVLSFSVLMLGLFGNRAMQSFNGKGVAWAMLAAFCIASYTIVDGIGVRIAGSSGGFLAILSFFQMLVVVSFCLSQRRDAVLGLPLHMKCKYIGGGIMSGLAFLLVLWAIRQDIPIALAAALRETSMIFALGYSVLLLGEKLNLVRILSVLGIFLGLIIVKLG